MVAAHLNIDYVDREIIADVAARLNYPEKKIEAKEMPAGTIMGRISEALKNTYPPVGIGEGLNRPIPMYLTAWEAPLDDPRYLKGLESVIKELAETQSIVIRGRGSQFILKDFSGAFHVLVVAPLALRIMRVMKSLNMVRKLPDRKYIVLTAAIRSSLKGILKRI
jgi:hypothetical protein